MNPFVQKLAREKIRQKIEERAARPNVFGALGDLISSIGYSIKERFDSAGLGGVSEDLGDLSGLSDYGVPPFGGGAGFSGNETIVHAPSPSKARYIIMPITLKADGGYWSPGATPTETAEPMATEINGETVVPPKAIFALHGRPQVLFRPEQLFLDSDESQHFHIYDIRVGKNSQFAASGTVPAKFFAEGNSIRLKLDTVQVSMDVSVLVQNMTNQPRTLHGVLFGPMVE
jgi:hypothetical protein